MNSESEVDVEIFRDPALDWVIDRIVKRLERGLELAGKISKSSVTSDERRAVDDLLGRKSTQGDSLSLDLTWLGQQYHLEHIANAIRGPIINLRAERDAETESWDQLERSWIQKTQNQACAKPWLEGVFFGGVLKRFASRDPKVADQWLDQAWKILKVPFHGDMLLASLAAQTTGDSHALDRGKTLANLCLRGIAAREGLDGSEDADSRREAWAAIGVVIDDLSAPVLCLNLRAEPGTDLAPWIDWHAARGEPYFIPWRQVRKFVPANDDQPVFVCENPSVISESAHRLGPNSYPLICMNGLPSAAVKNLTQRIGQETEDVFIRADFDWAGLKFVDQMRRSTGVTKLWQMTAEVYRNCFPSQPLKGTPYAPKWAKDLAVEMKSKGLAVYEEEIIDLLIEDLRKETNENITN